VLCFLLSNYESGGAPTVPYPDGGCTTSLDGINGAGLWIFGRVPRIPEEQLVAARNSLLDLGYTTSQVPHHVDLGYTTSPRRRIVCANARVSSCRCLYWREQVMGREGAGRVGGREGHAKLLLY
jgi:hypothetical protein